MYASVRNRRLECTQCRDRLFAELGVASVEELMESYQATASKIASLWERHGERERERESLEGETRELEREYARHTAAEAAAAASFATADKHENDVVESEAEKRLLAQKEAAVERLCETVRSLFERLPLLGREVDVNVTPENLVALLGIIENAAIKIVRRHGAKQLLESHAVDTTLTEETKLTEETSAAAPEKRPGQRLIVGSRSSPLLESHVSPATRRASSFGSSLKKRLTSAAASLSVK